MRKNEILFLTFDNFEMLDVVGPMEVFASATAVLGRAGSRAGYAITLAAETAGPVCASSGGKLLADRSYEEISGSYDTVIVSGGAGVHEREHPALENLIQQLAPRTRRFASVCTGAFLLARTGLLDGCKATTHWAHVGRFSKSHPAVDLQPDAIFIRDGNIFTSAGVTAGMDLALAMVEEDFGRELALAVARDLVMFLKRPGGQTQFSMPLKAQFRSASDRRLAKVEAFLRDNLSSDLQVQTLAHVAGMSPRNFARVFASAHGLPPAKFVELARVEAARQMLEETASPLSEIASEVGFASEAVMRRCFLRRLGVTPSGYRSRFRTSASQSSANTGYARENHRHSDF